MPDTQLGLNRFRWSVAIVAVATLSTIFFIEPRIEAQVYYKLFAWSAALATVYMLIAEYVDFGRAKAWWLDLGRTALLSTGMILIVLPPHEGSAAVIFALTILVLSKAFQFALSRDFALVLAGIVFFAGILITEVYLRQERPLETGSWGELPALQPHATRVYGLKPDLRTHLRYNNYDYELVSNSLGLPGPEIPAKLPGEFRILLLGDAFTMPEGAPYAQSYAAMLQSKLDRDAPRIRIINAGITGYGPNESLPQMRELVPQLQADYVVYQFFVNEFNEIDISSDKRLQSIGLAGQPQNLRTKYIGRSQTLTRLARIREALAEAITGRSPQWKFDMSFIAAYSKDGDVYDEDSLLRIATALEAMRDIANGNLSILYTPSAVEVTEPASLAYFPVSLEKSFARELDTGLPLQTLRRIASELSIDVWDPTAALVATEAAYHTESWHWTTEGHAAIADYLLPKVIAETPAR